MLDLKFVRENIDIVKQNTANKNESADIDLIIEFDKKRRDIITESQELKNLRNTVSKEIADLKKAKQPAEDKIAQMKDVSAKIKDFDAELGEIDSKLQEILQKIPNMLHESVPVGKSEADNKTIRTWGEQKEKIDVNHIDLAKKFNLIDFDRGAKVSGSGYSFYIGKAARLERALINFMIDYHIENHGYTEMTVPFLVNYDSMYGTGQLPKMAEDMYTAEADGMYAIPTSEVPLTNFHRSDLLKNEQLPVKFCAYSPCFRREAGSYGKEVHGLLRVHQFNKVELVNFTRPEDSEAALETITAEAEDILKALGLPYRVLLLCSGDTSFASSKTYDLEVYTPGEDKWLEVSSCSNFADFQARRANIRFKRDGGSKPEFVHTLNGSALATSRIMVAIMENYFDGEKIIIPDVLKNYCGFDNITL